MKKKLTMKDLQAAKGQRKLVMTNAADYNTARAAEAAGIDLITGRGLYDERSLAFGLDQLREGAPNTLIACNLPPTLAYVSDEAAVRCAMLARDHGADLIYSSGNKLSRLQALAELGIPVAGHVGLVPIRSTWLGGLRAVGKTVAEALTIYRDTMALQEIGAVAVELECVPAEIAAHITRQTTLVTISLGSGPDCDGQFLFSADVLGTFDGRYPGLTKTYDGPLPRHAKRYANLHAAAIEAFEAFVNEVKTSQFPAPSNTIHVGEEMVQAYLAALKESTS
jgi:3-methyl-2-oxobutanoate hydroxymethyltransferase